MSVAVLILRAVALLAFVGPGLIGARGRRGEKRSPSGERRGGRLPLLANFSGFGLFFILLAVAPRGTEGPTALLLALTGALVALTGSALVMRSRAELGDAWSLVPIASEHTPMLNWGLGLTGVRLPHYLAATALGIVPNLTVAVFFADTIVAGLAGSTPSSWVVVGGMLVVVAIATAAVARHLRRKRLAPPRGPLNRAHRPPS